MNSALRFEYLQHLNFLSMRIALNHNYNDMQQYFILRIGIMLMSRLAAAWIPKTFWLACRYNFMGRNFICLYEKNCQSAVMTRDDVGDKLSPVLLSTNFSRRNKTLSPGWCVSSVDGGVWCSKALVEFSFAKCCAMILCATGESIASSCSECRGKRRQRYAWMLGSSQKIVMQCRGSKSIVRGFHGTSKKHFALHGRIINFRVWWVSISGFLYCFLVPRLLCACHRFLRQYSARQMNRTILS